MNIHRPHIQKHISTQSSEDTRKYIPEKYRDFAEGMEAQFAEYMVKQMKKSISGESKNDPASNYYDDLMTKEYTKQLTQSNNGMGIQDLVLDEVYPKKFRNKEAYASYLKQLKNKSIRPQKKYEMHGPVLPERKIQMNKTSPIAMGVPATSGVEHE